MISWMLHAASMPNPVLRVDMTSEWSPKMERAAQATERAETWKTVLVSSPAILNMFGIIRSRPCEAVNVVVNAPEVSAPWTAPLAPPSDWSSETSGMVPKMFLTPRALSSSAFCPISEDGVIG